MKNSFIILIIFIWAVFIIAVPVEFENESEATDTDVDPSIIDEGSNSISLHRGDLLLLEWIPFPINQYRYIILNSSNSNPIEQGVSDLEYFTKEAYPNIHVALACAPGDGEYIYFDQIQVISVDAFKDDRYFQEYQDIIFTIHGFQSKIELWAHFFKYEEAFWPVQYRLFVAFQNYLENHENGVGRPESIEDFNENKIRSHSRSRS